MRFVPFVAPLTACLAIPVMLEINLPSPDSAAITTSSMVASIPAFAGVVSQIETATAQLRILSALPEAQRESNMKTASEDIHANLDTLEEQVKKLKSDVQFLQDTTENRLKALEAG